MRVGRSAVARGRLVEFADRAAAGRGVLEGERRGSAIVTVTREGPAPGSGHLAHAEGALGVDPALLVGALILVVTVLGAAVLGRAAAGRRGRRTALWVGGMASLAVALASPLEAWAEQRVSAHMVQHVLVLLVAGPLLAAANPAPDAFAWMRRGPLPGPARRLARVARAHRRLRHPATVAVLGLAHGVVLVVWHAPGVYEASLRSPALHVLAHTSMLVVAVLFWRSVISWNHVVRRGDGAALGYVLVGLGIAGLTGLGLSVLMTFAPQPWYDVADSYDRSADLSPLTDQQLAGLIMWAAGGPAYLVGFIRALVAALRSSPDRISPASTGTRRSPVPPPPSRRGPA